MKRISVIKTMYAFFMFYLSFESGPLVLNTFTSLTCASCIVPHWITPLLVNKAVTTLPDLSPNVPQYSLSHSIPQILCLDLFHFDHNRPFFLPLFVFFRSILSI